MKVNLSAEEYDLLTLKNILNSNLIKDKKRVIKKNSYYILEISKEDADTIRDLGGEQLQKIGFDKNYNPTSEGFILESLIDKFFADKFE